MRIMLLPLVVAGIAGCEREPEQNLQAPSAVPVVAGTETQASSSPAIIPKPKDQAQLDRLILAGYTPHSEHLHAPGVNECPLSKGDNAVM